MFERTCFPFFSPFPFPLFFSFLLFFAILRFAVFWVLRGILGAFWNTHCFLVACTRLYTSLCRSVCPSIGRSIITSRFWAFRAKRRADFSYCPCPATILPLPNRTQLMLPCIQPCFSLNTLCNDGFTRKIRPYTRQHQSRAGGQGQYGSWTGAVT